jgi:hemerythrin-like domain-containing protein
MFSNPISQTLHEEHCATIALMERLEGLIRRRRDLPNTSDAMTKQLLRELAVGVEAEVKRHFDFEENHLFTYLESIGDHAIGAHLTEEHSMMRPLGERLAALARTAESEGFDKARWDEFCRVGAEFIERMLVHVQKEEMALLPLIDDAMDSDTRARLFEAYSH